MFPMLHAEAVSWHNQPLICPCLPLQYSSIEIHSVDPFHWGSLLDTLPLLMPSSIVFTKSYSFTLITCPNHLLSHILPIQPLHSPLSYLLTHHVKPIYRFHCCLHLSQNTTWYIPILFPLYLCVIVLMHVSEAHYSWEDNAVYHALLYSLTLLPLITF